MITVDTANH